MLEVRGLSKEFSGYRVLDGIDFTLDGSRLLLLLGRNGAGKTTLIRCIAGVLRYEGEIYVSGVEVSREPYRARRMIGYVQQIQPVKGDLTGFQLLALHADIYGIDIPIDTYLEGFGLGDAVDTPISEYSGGMRQRLYIAAALMHNPKLLLMDEPFSNLDHPGRKLVVDILKRFKDGGGSIVVSSHTLSDYLPYADLILILDGGRLIYYGSPDDILAGIDEIKVYVRFSGDDIPSNIGDAVYIGDGKAVLRLGGFPDLRRIVSISNVESIYVEEPDIEVLIDAAKKL